jgi:hypothetical protein
MGLLQDNSDLFYGGLNFTIYASKARAKPIKDTAGRTTKYVEYEIIVERAFVEREAGQDDTSSVLEDMRRILTTQGLPLSYNDKGFGILDVDQVNVKDVRFGPEPELFDFQPFGSGVSAMVNWKVKTWIPACPPPDEDHFFDALAEFCFDQEHSLDKDGYSTISVRGVIEIAMTRMADGRKIPDHVDAYRERVQTTVPIGFDRQGFDWKTDMSKRIANFSWQDVQIRDALPQNITSTTLKHETRAKMPFVRWENTISGTVIPPPNVTKEFAFRTFLSLAMARWSFARNFRGNAADLLPIPPAAGGGVGGIIADVRQMLGGGADPVGLVAIIPLDARFGNEIAGRGVDCSFSYFVVRYLRLFAAVRSTGIWEPYPDTNFVQWRISMNRKKVTDVRGPSHVVFRKEDDSIVDLCVTQAPRIAPPNIIAGRADGGELGPNAINNRGFAVLGGPGENPNDPPLQNPEGSWVYYRLEVNYEEPRGRYARHRPLAGTVSDTSGPDAFGSVGALRSARRNSPASARTTQADILQEIGAPEPVVYLEGMATRIGEGVPMPRLISFRGMTAVLNRVVRWKEAQVGRWGDLRIMKAVWRQEYLLEKPPVGVLPRAADPLLNADGDNAPSMAGTQNMISGASGTPVITLGG